MIVEPLATRSLRDQVCDRLRDAILSGSLAPGERVSVSRIAETYGVSLMPVREALNRLASEGLVESAPRKWTRVALPDMRSADEVYPMIIVLERLALESASTDVDALRMCNQQLRVALAANDVLGCLSADYRFHSRLTESAGNATLTTTLAELRARSRLLESAYFHLENRKRSPDEHASIVDALAEGDRRAAQDLLRAHWQRGHDALRASLNAPTRAPLSPIG